MKKTLVSMLLIAASAVASAQVAVSGRLGAWAAQNRWDHLGSNTQMLADPNSMIAFSASENLGRGLTASARLETSLDRSFDGQGFDMGNRQATVGLSHQLAAVDLGRRVHAQFAAIRNNDAFGATGVGSIAGDIHDLRSQRISRAVFSTVTPMKGVTVNLDQGLQEDLKNYGWGALEVLPRAQAVSVNAQVLGVNAAVARFRQGTETSTVVAANGQLGPVRVFYTHSDNEGRVNYKGDSIGAHYALAPNITAKASYGRTDVNDRAYSVGVDLALSRRSVVGVAYKNADQTRFGTGYSQLAMGLVHTF